MKFNKITEFDLSDVTKLNSDYVIPIDESHYIGSYLSSGNYSVVSLDGLRFNAIDEVNMESPDCISKIYSVPTGVNTNISKNWRPKAFRYNEMIIYENYDLEESIDIYIENELVGNITEIINTERLIILTKSLIDPQLLHESSRCPHDWNRSFLTQSTLSEFTTIDSRDELLNPVPKDHSIGSVPDAFQILPPFTKVPYNIEYKVTNGEVSKVVTYREFDQPTLPAFSKKFI